MIHDCHRNPSGSEMSLVKGRDWGQNPPGHNPSK